MRLRLIAQVGGELPHLRVREPSIYGCTHRSLVVSIPASSLGIPSTAAVRSQASSARPPWADTGMNPLFGSSVRMLTSSSGMQIAPGVLIDFYGLCAQRVSVGT